MKTVILQSQYSAYRTCMSINEDFDKPLEIGDSILWNDVHYDVVGITNSYEWYDIKSGCLSYNQDSLYSERIPKTCYSHMSPEDNIPIFKTIKS